MKNLLLVVTLITAGTACNSDDAQDQEGNNAARLDAIEAAGYLSAESDPSFTEAAVDGFVANNGYLTAETDPSFTEAAVDAYVANNGYLTAETDPSFTEAAVDAYVANNGYVTAESDPTVGALTADRWCVANGSGTAVDCTLAPPVLSEVDPTVNGLGNADLSACVDGQVAKLTSGLWACAADDVGASGDASYGSSAASPDDAVFVDDDGNLGIGTATPTSKLHVSGGVQIADDASACDPSKEGTIRYRGNGFEGCDGTAWLCVAGACQGPRTVFLAQVTPNGNLGGLSGADDTCQAAADAAGLPGTFKAWLSDNTVSAASRLTHSDETYVKPDGTLIASNWNDLTDGTLASTINLDATGSPVDTSVMRVFTNTTAGGAVRSANSCNNWTSTSGQSGTGHPAFTDATWTDWVTNGVCSGGTRGLYCMQQ